MDFRSVGQWFAPETVDSGDGGVDVVHLETDVIDAEPQRLAVLSGLEFQDGNVEMTIGEIDSVLPQADLLQAEGLFVERRGLFDVSGSNGNVFDPGHGSVLRRFAPGAVPSVQVVPKVQVVQNIFEQRDSQARLFLVPDRGDIGGGGDIEERLLHQLQSHVVQLAVSRANAIFQNDDVIA
jgi:hypothetical protein